MSARERRKPGQGRIGLALAGGGPEGAVYEIGALKALDEALEGFDLNDAFIYIGVSAGSFLAANLANQITPDQMCRAIVKPEPGEHPFVPEIFLTPAYRELLQRGLSIPRLLFESFEDWLRNPRDQTPREALTRLGRALPVGLFDNEPVRAYLHRIFSIRGRSDDFRRLGKRLVVVAADLDSGEPVRFGEPGWDRVPISRAVQASTALPGLYTPVEIDGRHYVDGVLLKTLHASVALEAGARMVLCINPIVPVDTVRAVEQGVMRRGKLIDRGLPSVLSQTFRTLIHSRLRVGLRAYNGLFNDAKVILIEPGRDDYRMFFTNVFKFSDRRAVCEHAYRATRRQLLERREELEPILARHGIRLRVDLLCEDRDLWRAVGLSETPRPRPLLPRLGRPTLHDLDQLLDRLEHLVDEISR